MIPMESPLSTPAAPGQSRNARLINYGEAPALDGAVPDVAEDGGGEFELLITEDVTVADAAHSVETKEVSVEAAAPGSAAVEERHGPNAQSPQLPERNQSSQPSPEIAKAVDQLNSAEPVEPVKQKGKLLGIISATSNDAAPDQQLPKNDGASPDATVVPPLAELPRSMGSDRETTATQATVSASETLAPTTRPEGLTTAAPAVPLPFAIRDALHFEKPVSTAADILAASRVPAQPIATDATMPAVTIAPSGFTGLQATPNLGAIAAQQTEDLEIAARQVAELNNSRPETTRAPLAPTADARAVTAQVAIAIVKTDSGKLDIRLDPPELGRLSVTISSVDEVVSAVVAADRAETQDLLRRHADLLQRALRDAGYSDVKLDFSTSSENGQDTDGNAGFQSSEAATELSPKTDLLSGRASASGLDIRL